MTSTLQRQGEIKNSNPKIILFLCRWCSGKGADLAGTSRLQYPPNVLPIMVNCSSRIDPQLVVEAFLEGADGVLVTGCHLGDCHYVEGNFKTVRRMPLLFKMAEQFGINPARLKFEFVSASEGAELTEIVQEFSEELEKIGPGPFNKTFKK